MMDVEKAPIAGFQKRQASVTQEQSAWRTINTRVLGMGTAADKLKSDDLYATRQAVSSNTDVLTATVGTGSAVGNFSVSVESLAQNHQQVSQGFAAQDAVVGTGSITIKVGAASFNPITIDSTNNTLTGIRDAINKANPGVTASIIDAGESAGANRYRLSLNSNTSGTAGKIDANFSLGGSSPAMTDMTAAQDAHIKLGTGTNAVDVYSSTNTVTGAIDGVTMNLNSAKPGTTVNVRLSQNTAPVREAVQNFLDQYNSLSDSFNSNNSYDKTTQTSGVLFGNSVLQNLQGDVFSKVTNSRTIKGTSMNSLSSIGISVDDKGKLAITDNAAFEKALAKPDEMKKLFADRDNGIATNIRTFVDQQTSVVSGSLTLEDKRLTAQYDDLTASIERTQAKADRTEQRLKEIFLNLETALSSIKSQGAAISAQLGGLSSSSSSSSKSSS
ncbi:MAG: flagellar filament capping protein FliD [Candidatus Eremiobacteraeota bacterium]|nr:flagellar filament capping protein FliD [Candidatus Eremiobacteraeota bacterium]